MNQQRNRDFYQRLRQRMRSWSRSRAARAGRWTDYLMFAPDLFHLIWKLSLDPEVPAAEKAKLIGAVAYFVSPLDFVPEGLLGPVGYADDVALAAYVLNGLVNKAGPDIVRRHWAGDGDVLEVIGAILNVADRMVGSGVWSKLKRSVRL